MKLSFLQISSLSLAMMASGLTSAADYIVDRYQDDEAKGSLRWAIMQSNANKQEANQILIQPIGKAPYMIKLDKALPPIQSSVKIVGTAWEKNGEFIAIDGSNYIQGEGAKACPGANPEQYGTNVRTTTLPGFVLQDVNGVTLKGLNVQRFCIGVLINRSSNNLIQHNQISHNYGGAGVMITGDDGQGHSTATTTNNNKVLNNLFIDNGDGLELTRGAAFNLIANNIFTSTAANPEPSQGIEILWGNDNSIVGNLFENYSDGLQINWGKRNYIAFNELRHNSLGFNISGDGNLLDRNKVHSNRIGIAVRSEKDPHARTQLTQNQIWNNGKDIKRCEAGGSCVPDQRLGSIVFNVPALEHADFVGSRGGGVVIEAANLQKTCAVAAQKDCNATANQAIQAPVLSLLKGEIVAQVKGQPNQRYVVEFFGNQQAKGQEAEQYLDQAVLFTNAKGVGQVQWKNSAAVASITATATDAQGATSELSVAVSIR